MTEVIGDGKALIEQIAKALVDDPAQVAVDEYEDEGEQVLELTVAEGDLERSSDARDAPHVRSAPC